MSLDYMEKQAQKQQEVTSDGNADPESKTNPDTADGGSD